jgi:ABC-type antimicrobial peptide transport system permease subunit
METSNSLNHSMNSALKHYSSMFFLPSFQKAIAAVALICVGGVGISTFFVALQLPGTSLVDGLAKALILGFSLFAAVLLADYLVSKTALRRDPIYVLRRAMALSLFCWILWLFFVILGVIF